MSLLYDGNLFLQGKWGWKSTPEKTDYPVDDPTGAYIYDIRANGSNEFIGYTTDRNLIPEDSYIYDDGTFYINYQSPPETIQAVKNSLPSDRGTIDKDTWDFNANNQNRNAANTAINSFHGWAGQVINAVAGSGGYYKYLPAKKQIIDNGRPILINAGLSEAYADTIINQMVGYNGQFRNYYATERVQPWDPSVLPANLDSTVKERNDLGKNFNTYRNGAKGYYIKETTTGKAAEKAWNEALLSDDLDIITRYGSLEGYAKYDYLQQITDPTKSRSAIADIRGSEAAPLSPFVTEYREQVFPDAEKQQTLDEVQNKIFGLVTAKTPGATGYEFRDIQQGLSDLISSDKNINKLWTDAKSEILLSQSAGGSPGQWTKLINSLGAKSSMITDQDSFGTLLSRVATLNSADANDKKIIDDNNALFKTVSGLKSNTIFQDLISYTPAINDAFTASVQASEKANIEKFGQMRQGILQDTIEQLKLAKRQENNISFFKSSSVGQELSALTQDIKGSLLGDLAIGGITPLGSSQQNLNKQLDLGLGDIFGTKNGLIYNWEDWFNNQIEKKYAGGIDIPNDYVAPRFRTLSNGFVDTTTAASWKKYDDAYAVLKTNPNDLFAKAVVSGVPIDYVPVANRKTINKTWTDYETQLKTAGYVDPQKVASWAKYDEEYKKTGLVPKDAPLDYVVPNRRMDLGVQFAKDFFSTYLKPRFDASQSISEFQDLIDVVKSTQNPFQTQDRLDALKLAAQTSVSKWFADLQQAGDSKFNSDYYFDPNGYLKAKGVGDPANPLLPGAAFTDYALTDLGKRAQQQSAKVNADWVAAKKGESSKDEYGKDINWLLEAYNYGVNLNDKAAFAQLHYQLVGLSAPKLNSDGQIVRKTNGDPEIDKFDAAPTVYAPLVARTYITQILTPYLIDKANKIGTVFGEFIKPSDYVDQILKVVNLPENKEQFTNILKSSGLDPNASLSELRNTLVDALTQDSTIDIKKRIGDLIKEGKTPTQTELGVEYLQKATVSGTTTAASGVYGIFKNAGYNGSESDFYATFLPGSSKEDISILNAAYTPAGQKSSLLPTISGTGTEQIASMAQLFGDTSITEVLGTAGISVPTGESSFIGGLFGSSEDDVGIGDPFADASTPFASTKNGSKSNNNVGIGNPFDEVGIGDPFAEDSDPFSSSNPFASIGSTSSVSNPTINTNVNIFTQGFSSKKNSSIGSLFDSFGGSFGF